MKNIQLTQGKMAIVDDEDFSRLNQFRWHARTDGRNWYAERKIYTKGDPVCIRMHHFVMGKMSPVDHKNGNGLDNRKENLRFANEHQNGANRKKQKGRSSRYKGVCFREDIRKWRAYICVHQHLMHLGSYDSEKDAAISYNQAAMAFFGDFARLNPV